MAKSRIDIGEEVGTKKTFVWALEWPGWARGAKTPELAREALVVYAPRYAIVATEAGLALPSIDDGALDVVDSVGGGSGTDFGVPSSISDRDRERVTPAQAARLADLSGRPGRCSTASLPGRQLPSAKVPEAAAAIATR